MDREIIEFNIEELNLTVQTISSDKPCSWRKSHIHDAVEFVYVNSGKIAASIESERIVLSCGEILLINSNVTHRLECITHSELTYMQIQIPEYEYTAGDKCLYNFILNKKLVPYCHMSGKNELAEIFFNIKNEIREKQKCYEIYVNSYIQLLTAFMLRNGMLCLAGSNTINKLNDFIPLIDYIEKHYSQPLTLDELSDLTGYSKFALCRGFKSVTGRTVVEYINYVRLRYAKKILRENRSVTEAACKCGFSSVQYFSKIFYKYNGCTPSNYKRKLF